MKQPALPLSIRQCTSIRFTPGVTHLCRMMRTRQSWIIPNPKSQTSDEVLVELQERAATDADFTIQSIHEDEMLGYPGYSVEYRFGGANRYGAASMAEIGNRLVLWDFNAGSWCDVAEIAFSEQEAMIRFGETFRFLDE